MNHGLDSQYKKDRGARTESYSSIEELFLDNMGAGNGRLWSVKQRTELKVRLRLVGAFLNLDSAKEKEFWIPIGGNDS